PGGGQVVGGDAGLAAVGADRLEPRFDAGAPAAIEHRRRGPSGSGGRCLRQANTGSVENPARSVSGSGGRSGRQVGEQVTPVREEEVVGPVHGLGRARREPGGQPLPTAGGEIPSSWPWTVRTWAVTACRGRPG